jgi:hypothetical protein
LFQEFDTLLFGFLESVVGIVTYVRTSDDRHRQDLTEDILYIVKEAIDLDCLFLFSKGEEVSQRVLTLMDKLYDKSMSLNTKHSVLQILFSIFIQVFGS